MAVGAIGHLVMFTAVIAMLMARAAAQGRKWTPSISQLETPRAIGATVFYNESFLIVGGCEDPSCQSLSRAMTTFGAKDTVLQELPPLPTFVEFGRYREFVGVAGFYSTVTVGTYLLPENDVSTQVWVVGTCSMHFLSEMSLIDALKFRSFWGLSADLNRVDRLFQTDSSVPLRVNASCATFGSNIYVVGGVLWDSRELTNSVDVFNVAFNVYQTNVFQHAVAVMNAAVAIDSNMLYIAGGQTTIGSDTIGNGSTLTESQVVLGYRWPPLFLLNQSLPLLPVRLPNNTHTKQHEHEGKTLARIFAFAGFLVMIDRTDAYSYFSMVDQQGSLVDGLWAVESSGGTHTSLSSVIAFSLLDHFEGTRLTFYSFGGFTQEAGSIVASPAIFFRFTSISIPGPLLSERTVTPVDAPFSIQLVPPSRLSWVGRLSPNIVCISNTSFTRDEPVLNSTVTFVPQLATPKAFLCLGRVASALEIANLSFFTVCDPYTYITVLLPIPSSAPPTLRPSVPEPTTHAPETSAPETTTQAPTAHTDVPPSVQPTIAPGWWNKHWNDSNVNTRYRDGEIRPYQIFIILVGVLCLALAAFIAYVSHRRGEDDYNPM